MPSMFENAFTMWTAPLHAARLTGDIVETVLGAQRVIAARLPMIGSAMCDPLNADHVELNLMVSEKVSALQTSGKSLTAAGVIVKRASAANVRVYKKVAGGGLMGPADWMRLFEVNMAAAATLTALPAAALAPIHRGVKANDQRFSR